MRNEYDFSKGVRGKYAKRYAEGTNVVLLEPDVAKEFPDAAAVNESFGTFCARRRSRRVRQPNNLLQADKGKLSRHLPAHMARRLAFAAELGR